MTGQATRRPVPWRAILVPASFAVPALVVLIMLGNWQMDRLAWKEDLIARIERGLAADPVPLPPLARWNAVDPTALDYTRATATGTYDHGAETHVHLPSVDGRTGYHILTPLRLTAGGTLLVDRGWVPEAAKAPEKRPEGQVEGEVTVTGVLRVPDAPNSFTPDPDLEANMWFARDMAGIGAHIGAETLFPLLLEADGSLTPGTLPEGGQTRIALRNPHLGYAWTWYGLAGALAGVYIAFVIARLRTTSASEEV